MNSKEYDASLLQWFSALHCNLPKIRVKSQDEPAFCLGPVQDLSIFQALKSSPRPHYIVTVIH